MLIGFLAGVGVTLLVVGFVALALWSRRSERDNEWDHNALTEDEANSTRLGVALSYYNGHSGNF